MGCFLFNETASTEIYTYGHTLSLHDALPIWAALQRQLAWGTCFSNPTLTEIALAELLCARVPHFEHLRFANTGTEAVMLGVKAARDLTGRSRIAKCEGAYQGGDDLVEVRLDPTPATRGEPLPRPAALTAGHPPTGPP